MSTISASSASRAAATPRPDLRAQTKATLPADAMQVTTVWATDPLQRTLAGTLMVGRTASGEVRYWLKGRTASHLLRNPGGRPVANALDAAAAAKKFIGKQSGRTDLLEVQLTTGQQLNAPNRNAATVTIDLESSQVNRKAGEGRAFKNVSVGYLPPGSGFTAQSAINDARLSGLQVEVREYNASAWPSSMASVSANVTLPNTRQGGYMFARLANASGDPTQFRAPAFASNNFISGFNEAMRNYGVSAGLGAIQNLATAGMATRRNPVVVQRPATFVAGSSAGQLKTRPQPPAPGLKATNNAAANIRKALPTASANEPNSGGLPTQASAGPSAGQSSPIPRSLPEPVRNVLNKAAANNVQIPLQVVTKAINGLGNVPARDAVDRLVKDHGLPVAQARELVGAIRMAQQRASTAVKSVIDRAGARTGVTGLSRPSFTMSDWNSVEPWTRHMPKTDNPVARQLIKMKSDGRFTAGGNSTIEPRAMERINKYLRSAGYDAFGGSLGANAAKTIATNPTVLDKVFMQMLGRRGATGSASGKVVIGVIDLFRDPKQPNHPANFSNQQPLQPGVPAALEDRAHGAAVTSVATAGAGNRLEVKTFGLNTSNFAQGVQSLVNNGARAINVSLSWNDLDGAKTLRDAVRNHPGVHFVVAAGNGLDRDGVGRHTGRLSLGETILAGSPNVTHVGSVDRNGQLSRFSNYQGSTALYAWGEGRTTAGVGASYDQNQRGTSLAAPMVAGLMGKVKTLDPGLDLAGVKRIVTITADKVRQTTTTDPALKGKTLLVVNSDDAVRLAAMTGLVRRGASMDSAMQKLGFDAATRAKIEPRARQILGAERRELDKWDAPGSSRHARATIRVQRPDDLPNVNGYQLTDTIVRKLSGNRPGSAVEATQGKHGLIHLEVERDKAGTQSMSMSIDTKMNRLVIEKDGGLWRSTNDSATRERLPSVVRSVLQQAQALGLTQVEVRRPSADMPHGHEYWARIGFTGIAKDSAMMLKLSKTQSTGVAIKDIGPLIGTPSGRQIWKEAGASSVSLMFDLRADSDSWRRLDARATKSQQN